MKPSTLYRYKFSNGEVVTTYLSADECLRRMNRLGTLMTLVEQSENDVGQSIYRKALQAYNKLENFTGIIRLSFREKDWLSYMLESDMLSDKDIDAIKFYTRY